MDNGALTEI